MLCYKNFIKYILNFIRYSDIPNNFGMEVQGMTYRSYYDNMRCTLMVL